MVATVFSFMGFALMILSGFGFLKRPSYKASGVLAAGAALLTGGGGVSAGDPPVLAIYYAILVGVMFFAVSAGLVAAGRLARKLMTKPKLPA